jgi:hypothetical protein
MKITTFPGQWQTRILIFTVGSMVSQGSLVEVNLPSPAFYTPGKIPITLQLTEQALLEGPYSYQISVFSADSLVRQQILPAQRSTVTTYEVSFPVVRSRTTGRCRVELFFAGQFLEAQEKPFSLWPPLASLPVPKVKGTVLIYDVSGQLQRLLSEWKIPYSDAAFQPQRDFAAPALMLLGENLPVESIKTIQPYLDSIRQRLQTLTLVVFRQTQYTAHPAIKIVPGKATPRITWDANSPLLAGLENGDLLTLAPGSTPLVIAEPNMLDLKLVSAVSLLTEGHKELYSYLLLLQRQDLMIISCQFPLVEKVEQNPLAAILLGNLMGVAARQGQEAESLDNAAIFYDNPTHDEPLSQTCPDVRGGQSSTLCQNENN